MAIDNLTNLRIVQQPQSPPQIIIPIVEITPGFALALMQITAVDLRDYSEDDNVRKVSIHTVGGDVFEFRLLEADKVYHWYLQFTGQAKVKQV